MKRTRRLECPTCRKTDNRIVKKWHYSVFDVNLIQCDCGEIFRAYYAGKYLKFILSNSGRQVCRFQGTYYVALIDEKCKILKIRQISKAASLLNANEEYSVFSVGTIKAMIDNFPNTGTSKELESFIPGANSGYILFTIHENQEGKKQHILQHKKSILQTIESRRNILGIAA